MTQDFEAQNGVMDMLKRLPRENESDKSLLRAYSRCSSVHGEKDPDGRPEYFTYDTVYRECLHLYYLTTQLHRHNYKVLVYGGRCHEIPEILQLNFLCGVDGLCPNNVSLACQIVREKTLCNKSLG